MLPRKRLLLTIAAAGLVALPAAVLAGLCLGNACERAGQARGRIPFCSLPLELRSLIANGFRDGRSPHVLAVSGPTPVSPHPDFSNAADGSWPSLDDAAPKRIPLAFAGTGISPGAEFPEGTTLDALAPSLAEIIGLRRPHPGVRSGEAVVGIASGETPRLALLVVWKNVTSRELEQRPQLWPVLRGLMEDGAATLQAETGSLPTDPAAILTTIGTGALPSDHGITGSLVRNDQGDVVLSWDKGAPFSVVAALGDDLDELEDQASRIGLVATSDTDRGLIGGNWYIEHDRDDFVIEYGGRRDGETAAAEKLLASGYGSDSSPDLLAVVMEGGIRRLDQELGRIIVAAERASSGSFAMAVTSTGSGEPAGPEGVPVSVVEEEVERAVGGNVIEASTPGGFFLDQDAMTRLDLSDDRVVTALRQVKTEEDEPLFADVFPAIAVTFARYC
ncbi:MAG: hypothetical protein ACRDHM_06760 [Actinomycetota bacterium]